LKKKKFIADHDFTMKVPNIGPAARTFQRACTYRACDF